MFKKFIIYCFAKIDLALNAVRAKSIVLRFSRVGESVRLRMPLVVYQPESISLGSFIDLGEFVILRGGGGVTIGNRVLIAAGVAILSEGHPVDLPRWRQVRSSAVCIGNDVWIGANAVILPGVSLGDGVVVAAGAVVSRDVAPYTVVAGIPAREIRQVKVS
ncbi:MAG: acyltransferase [Burkholderiales bacterium]|nr:acyltransferase [Burkholderiales bacterium]